MTEGDPIRSEVVDAVFKALTRMDPSALAGLTSVTPAERQAAEDLFLASMMASRDHATRETEVWEIVIKRQWETRPSWDQLWAELNESDMDKLRERYDALPDPLRRRLDEHDGQQGGA